MLPKNWLNIATSELAQIAPVQKLELPIFEKAQIQVAIKREDLLHPFLGGNKFYKLHAFLRDYQAGACNLPIASFGGAHSNHIIATAQAAKMLGIPSIGIIRGEKPSRLSATLQDAEACGMQLFFITRSAYRQKQNPDFTEQLEQRLGPAYWIPEGGTGTFGARGMMGLARGIVESLDTLPDYVVHACGTGTSLAGLAAGFAETGAAITCLGVPVLRGDDDMAERIAKQVAALTERVARWRLLGGYHGGGYARINQELVSFMQNTQGVDAEKMEISAKNPRLLLDPVYTLKMMWALVDLAERGEFAPGTRILAIHSGGIQGRRGFNLSD